MTGPRVTFSMSADSATIFAPEAFEGNVGKIITVNLGYGSVRGELMEAVVAEDRRSVRFTVEFPAAIRLPDGFELHAEGGG